MKDRGYSFRKCQDHYHVTVCGEDLITGYCETEVEAAHKANLLNAGASLDDVLGNIFEAIFPDLPTQ